MRTGVRVDALAREGDRYVVAAGDLRFEADNVVVAMSSEGRPRTPEFASQLDPRIVQLHSVDYRNPSQLQDGDVLLVGAGNSGADIAMEIVQRHTTLLSGRDVGHVPFPINRFTAGTGYHVVRFNFHHLMKADSSRGRTFKRYLAEGHGLPLVRVKPKQLLAAGVQRVGRTVGVRDGRPLLDGRSGPRCRQRDLVHGLLSRLVLDRPRHLQRRRRTEASRGVVDSEPGLYFVGLDFLYAASSGQINGVSRDADHVVRIIASRRGTDRAAGPALTTS